MTRELSKKRPFRPVRHMVRRTELQPELEFAGLLRGRPGPRGVGGKKRERERQEREWLN